MKYFKDIATLLLFSLALSFFYNYFSPSGISVIGNWDKTKGVVSANTKTSVVSRDREINSLIKMRTMVKENKALIIDVRVPESFNKGHIPHARSIPLSEFDELIGNLYETVTMEQRIIAYCSGRECTDSHIFANKLSELGYTDVLVFAGGFDEWAQEGGEVEKN